MGVGSYKEGFIFGYRDVITSLETTHDLPSKRWLRGYDDGRSQAEHDLNPFGLQALRSLRWNYSGVGRG